MFALIVCLLTGADQFTKQLVSSYVPLHDGYEVIPGCLNIVHERNRGGAFGMLSGSDSSFRPILFLGASLLALVGILWLLRSSPRADLWLTAACSFFFAGALGNLVDRLRFGEVVDFLDFHVHGYHWPAFNVADSALCIGAGLFFIHFLLGGSHGYGTEDQSRT